MFNRKQKIQARFFRNSSVVCIEVYLPREEWPLCLFEGIVDYCSRVLGEKEIAKVIDILSRKKEAMLKHHNFPLIYDEMLFELIGAQRKRYDVQVKKEKKRKLGYSVSVGKLEEILSKYYNLEKVFIHSIHAGSSIQDTKTIVLRANKEKDDRVLFVNFHEKEREDE
jgi:hypothetical protein